MSDNIKFFTADYRDKFVYVNKNKFTIGSFTVDFLNQYKENDNGARIAAMAFDNQILSSSSFSGEDCICNGYACYRHRRISDRQRKCDYLWPVAELSVFDCTG